jgi:stearoyl-CoA desaturase (Delta-9 desaturase)
LGNTFKEGFLKHLGPSSLPFLLIHVLALGLIITGMGWAEFWLIIGLYFGRMFFVTAGYHRYFSHRNYRLNRFWQFWMAFFSETTAQKGAIWWASHHRVHHRLSDLPGDVHSPKEGFWWSHVGWILSDKKSEIEKDQVPDLLKYPELVWLDRLHLVPPVLLGAVCFLWGGWSFLFAFFASTVLLWHGTFTINSLSHVFGKRRYATTDTSRNNPLLAFVTMGEGWHNNHHHFPGTARQGFFWYEWDPSWYILSVLSWVGIVKDMRGVPTKKRDHLRIRDGHADIGMMNNYLEKAGLALSQVTTSAGELCDKTRTEIEHFVESAKIKAHDIADRYRAIADSDSLIFKAVGQA